MEQLAFTLRKFGRLTNEMLIAVYSIARQETFKAGHKLLRPGRPGRCVYFIESGILQVYKDTPKGVSIDYLLITNDLCIATDSFVTGEPTNYTIAALTETRTISTTWDQLAAVMNIYPELRDCVFAIIEEYRKEKDWRYSDLLEMDAEERIDWFRKKYPGLIGSIKDKHIWTFLKLSRKVYYDAKNGKYKGKPPKKQ